jgi:hypothetical protein
MKKILLLIFTLLSSLAFAKDYYIDYTTGNDSNSGTSSVSPWKNVSKVGGAGFLLPGDHVYIARGSHFVGADARFTINSMGTSSNHIVIQPYGVGADPIFDGSTPTSSIPGWTGWTLYSGSIWKSTKWNNSQ